VATRACGARVRHICATIAPFDPDIDAIGQELARTAPPVLWLCHPNNPTGRLFPIEALGPLIAASPQTLFVFDEAYIALSDGVQSALSLCDGGHVAVVRSMTKDFALAGLRLGYAIAAPTIVEAVRRVVPPWSVNTFAQAAGLAALSDTDHLERARVAVASSRAHLTAGLYALGLAPHASVANFVLVPVGDARATASGLLSRGFAVRDCSSFGLPDCIRIGVRAIAEQELLLSGLAELLRG
jgi:histidinol-phosphate aminotransferase